MNDHPNLKPDDPEGQPRRTDAGNTRDSKRPDVPEEHKGTFSRTLGAVGLVAIMSQGGAGEAVSQHVGSRMPHSEHIWRVQDPDHPHGTPAKDGEKSESAVDARSPADHAISSDNQRNGQQGKVEPAAPARDATQVSEHDGEAAEASRLEKELEEKQKEAVEALGEGANLGVEELGEAAWRKQDEDEEASRHRPT
jgi:hypothetical protein